MIRPNLIWPTTLALCLAASSAFAQFGPNPSQQPTQPGGDEDKEGGAEEAPKTPATLPTTPVLPPRRVETAKYQLFNLGGYFRWRGDWFKNFDEGFVDDPALGGAPFPNPLGCFSDNGKCEHTIKSSNIRLRLEPVISLRENSTQVFMQIDVLDNTVLGETPNTFTGNGAIEPPGNTPIAAFSNDQVAPTSGINNRYSSLRIKRAWAEVETALGRLHVGRMPWAWGAGIYANSGSYDPIHGTYDLDNDYGTTVDRLMFARGIPGTNLSASIAMDWTSTFPTSSQTDWNDNLYQGQPFDLDDNDDVNQWVFTLMHRDTPKDFDAAVARGDFALNYGAFVAYRTESYEQTNVTLGEATDPDSLVRRKAKTYIPDVWVRLAKGAFDFELEAVGIWGTIDDLTDQIDPDAGTAVHDNGIDVHMFGGVAKAGYRFLDGDIRVGAEVGTASGDQWDNIPPGRTNVRWARRFPGSGDSVMSAYNFNFAYNIDLILFRELIGTVANATYLRPTFDWKIGDSFRAKAQGVLSFANVPVATPGNGNIYGLELDADFGYESGGFFAGIAYGVLFPFDALDHPDSAGLGGPGFGYADDNIGSADTSQTIQMRLMVKF